MWEIQILTRAKKQTQKPLQSGSSPKASSWILEELLVSQFLPLYNRESGPYK